MEDTARMKAILVLVAAVLFAASPYMFGAFGGFAPDAFPVPQDRPPVQPAGYAFAIWGLIYLWLIVGAGFGLFMRSDHAAWDPARGPLLVSLIVGVGWIPVAQVSPVAATVMIWVMLLTAVWALMRTPMVDRWWWRVPVALYAGWLTAASFVSIGLLGAGYGIGFGETGWAYLALLGALGFAVLVIRRLGGVPEYAAAVVWALVAVLVKNWGVETGVAVLALLGAVGVAGLSLTEARRAA